MRLAACLLLLAAAAAAQHGRVLGREIRAGGVPPGMPPGVNAGQIPDSISQITQELPANSTETSQGHSVFQPPNLTQSATIIVLILAAIVPLLTKSRRWRTLQLVLDMSILGFWGGTFLSNARLVAWAGSGLPQAPADLAAALLMLSMALLYPVLGRASHYCLHVCPFGAAQELVGRLPTRKLNMAPSLVRRLTALRRALWGALMLATWCGAWSWWMEWELFGALAWRAVPPLLVALAMVFIILSAFVPRAYCRFVCPTGTFLKLTESNKPEKT